MSDAGSPGEALLTIEDTAQTRVARRDIRLSNLTGPVEVAAVGVLLLPEAILLFLERPLWEWRHLAWVLWYCAVVVLTVLAALWQRRWRGVPAQWQITPDGIYRGERVWVRWQDVLSCQVSKVLSGDRVLWSALKLRARGRQPNLIWGSPYIPFDPQQVGEDELVEACRQFTEVLPRAESIRWAPPWLVKLVLAVLALAVVLTWLVARWALQAM